MGHNGSYWELNFYGNIEDDPPALRYGATRNEKEDEDEGGVGIWPN